VIEPSQIRLPFARLSGKQVEADFSGGTVTSDGGVLFLRTLESQMGLVSSMVDALRDRRHPSYIDHTLLDLVKQRVFQIACGYEDAVDCDELRHDPGIKAACDRLPLSGPDLGSQSTMTRFENDVRRTTCIDSHKPLSTVSLPHTNAHPRTSFSTSMTQTIRHTGRNSFHSSTRITMSTAICPFISMKVKVAS